MKSTNYQHIVGKIESRFDQHGRLYVRFLFRLADGSEAYFRGPDSAKLGENYVATAR